jgi:protein-S-isoprenylcysteine O-methyltransferase Ste14/pimeloyl-ACP methyl ester carboxylesterase
MLRRALLAVVALPGVVAFAVPLLLARTLQSGSFRWIALSLLVPGMALFAWCVREFYVRGKGTLAPWDPPRHLVASGPYRVSRNPMYLSVALILFGWAIAFSSRTLTVYALAFLLAGHLRVVFGEERFLMRTHRDEWTRYAARVPRWLFRSRRAVIWSWIGVIAAAPIAGMVYEAYADGMAGLEFAAPGQRVDIGGRSLHLLCVGEGEPTVFFESSGWGTSVSTAAVRERLATQTTVCSYDRAGNGWSDPGPSEASAADLARDLAVLQDRAKVRWPVILVASSIGGLTAEMFARQYPERVAGLVLVDAANSELLPLLGELQGRARAALCTASLLAHFGVVRLIDPFDLNGAAERRQAAALTYSPRPWGQLCAMARGLARTTQEFAAAPPLARDLPLTVLSASSTDGLIPPAARRLVDVKAAYDLLQASHKRMAFKSNRGHWQMVPDSPHLIPERQPDAVAEAVLAMIATPSGVGRR